MHTSAPDGEINTSVGAVIAAHQPTPDLVISAEAVLDQVVALVIVVDEHPVSPASRAVFDACCDIGAEVVEHDRNRGIGAALNTGVSRLLEMHPTLTDVLTLDQDSLIPPGYGTALLTAGAEARRRGVHVGMVAPATVGTILRLPRRRHAGVIVGGEPIQSGLLIPTTVLARLGGFDESLFIDGVDTDFYLRATDLGLRCIIAADTRLEHRLGQAIATSATRDLPLNVAATFRYHYQWRNLIALLRSHARRHPVWAVRAVTRAVRHLAIVTVLAPGRATRLREAYSGVRAGLHGEQGRRISERSGHARTERERHVGQIADDGGDDS